MRLKPNYKLVAIAFVGLLSFLLLFALTVSLFHYFELSIDSFVINSGRGAIVIGMSQHIDVDERSYFSANFMHWKRDEGEPFRFWFEAEFPYMDEWYICIPGWFIVLCITLVHIPIVRYFLGRSRVLACTECGYELVGLPAGAPCPECGKARV